MNKTLLLAGVAAVLCASQANAVEIKQYVSGKLTYSDVSADVKYSDISSSSESKEEASDNVLGGSFAYGIKLGALRTELELNLKGTAEKKYADEYETWKNSLENNSIMLNTYYDIDTGTKLTPYVGAGMGLARLKSKIDLEDAHYSKSKTSFAWQIGAGFSYAVTNDVSLDAGYRYTDSGDISGQSEDEKIKFDSSSHEFLLGARYMF